MRFHGTAKQRQMIAMAAVLVAMIAGDAFAFSRGRAGSYGSYGSGGSYGSYGSGGSYGSYGSSGSYASSGSYGSSGSYASSGSYGSSGSSGRVGLFARWHARKAARAASSGSYGSSGSYASSGSYGSYSVSYSSSGSYGSSYSSGGSYGSYSAPVEYSAPIEYSTPVEAGCADCVGGVVESSSTLAAAGEAAIKVSVPADARVFVNDSLTTSQGADRHFVSRGLSEGMTYSYALRVEFEKDGKTVVEKKQVRLQPGQSAQFAFGGDAPATQVAKTELKVTVPAEAKVYLAGAATTQTGEVRTFATDRLAAGQTWDGYVVRVELTRNGEKLVKEKKMTIQGGESYDLAFEFDDADTRIAAAH